MTCIARVAASALACAALIVQEGGAGEPAASTGVSQRGPQLRVVVSTFDEQGVPPGMGDFVADMIIRTIDSPDIEILERRQVRRVLDEQAFRSTDLVEPGDALEYGRLVDSRYVLIGTVYRIDGNYIVSARLVDTKSGIIHERARAVQQFRTVDEMTDRISELVRTLGLCKGCPAPAPNSRGPAGSTGPAPPASLQDMPARTGPDVEPPVTVRDYLARIGDPAAERLRISLEKPARQLCVGEDLSVVVESERDGYLSLVVVDAQGAVAMLIPNRVVPEFRVSARTPVVVPTDAGFRLRIRPPLGATLVKAVVTARPMPLLGGADLDGLVRPVRMSDALALPTSAGVVHDLGQWSSAELEFLVIPERTDPPTPAVVPAPEAAIPVARAEATVQAALEDVQRGVQSTAADPHRILRWPLVSVFDSRIDIRGDRLPTGQSAPMPRVGVIDADFDPDDPTLVGAFARLDLNLRESLRREIRRNGDAPFRHGTRVASLIAGVAPWLPSVAPGAEIIPIAVTSQVDGPSYRVHQGNAREIIHALRVAMNAQCRVVNLSLSVSGDDAAIRDFIADPIWDELERANIVLVCAAGNSGTDLDQRPSYPACIDRPNILCVGAIGPDGEVAEWSAATTSIGRKTVDIMAPGTLLAVSDDGGTPVLASGTSYSCALATGTIARVLQYRPSLTAAETVALVVSSARQTSALESKCRAGMLTFPQVVR